MAFPLFNIILVSGALIPRVCLSAILNGQLTLVRCALNEAHYEYIEKVYSWNM